MRIFSKKAFQFDHPKNAEPPVIVQAGSFADVPDWVADSKMFKLASLDNDVTVIESKKDEIAAETGASGKSGSGQRGGKKQTPNDPPVDPNGSTANNPEGDPEGDSKPSTEQQ